MKILLYSMNFAPELAGVGRYSGEMAQWLSSQGHTVSVIASAPFFPKWKVFSGYSGRTYSRSQWQGFTVWRAPVWVPSQPRALARMVHLLSFTLSSTPLLLAHLRWRPDVVLVVAPPLFCAPAALLFSKLLGIKAWLHIQDFEVDAAFNLGLVRGDGLRRVALSLERWLLGHFDRVSTLTNAMLRRVQDKGVAPDRLVLFPNWVDLQAICPRPLGASDEFRKALHLPSDAVVVLYAGSIGNKQGIELLAQAAALLEESTDIHFVVCGNGPGRASLERSCSGLSRVHFIDLQPLESLGALLNMADIHVLPQRHDAADLMMPSKLTGMFASGRAVVATANPDTELSLALEGRGVVVPPGDARALADAIARLAVSRSYREDLGARGRAYAEAEWDRDDILQRFALELQRCIAAGNGDQQQ